MDYKKLHVHVYFIHTLNYSVHVHVLMSRYEYMYREIKSKALDAHCTSVHVG